MKSFIPFLAGAGFASAYTIVVADRFMEKNIDPIVVPGKYTSHMHTFFGSDAVTANTATSEELQAGCSTAENPNDFSVYWVPTLVVKRDDGSVTPVTFSRFSAYYVGIESAEIAIPQNYRSVAGNASAASQDDVPELSGQEWFCENDPGEDGKDPAAFPTKTCSTHLQTLLLFHDCVNPDTLESDYSGTQHWDESAKPENRCPEGMYRQPQLRFSIRYDLREVLADGWDGPPPLELACGGSYCMHGDFINGWLPEAAENMLKANNKREFAGVDGPLGEYNAGSVCEREAEDADPENGTSDYLESMEILEGLSGAVAGRSEPEASAAFTSTAVDTRVGSSPTTTDASEDASGTTEKGEIPSSTGKAPSDILFSKTSGASEVPSSTATDARAAPSSTGEGSGEVPATKPKDGCVERKRSHRRRIGNDRS